MGASESTLSSPQSQRPIDDITTVSYKSESVDPILENIKSLKITTPILTSPPPTESSLTDILVRRSSTSSASGTVNPKVLLELFSMYRDWQEEKAKQISKRQSNDAFLDNDQRSEGRFTDIIVSMITVCHLVMSDESICVDITHKQEEIENKIEVADALATKLLQRFGYSVSAMKTSSQHLSEVHALQVEIGELKGRLTEVISNCDALCKRIAAEGPDSLKASIKPLAVTTTRSEVSCSSFSLQKDDKLESSSTEGKLD